MGQQFLGSEYQNDHGRTFVVYEDIHRKVWIAENNDTKIVRPNKRQLKSWLRKNNYKFRGYTPL